MPRGELQSEVILSNGRTINWRQIKSARKNAAPFVCTPEVISEAFEANISLGNPWTEEQIIGNWSLIRSLVIAEMKADGQSCKEIALALGVSRGHIKNMLDQLRYKLKRRLAEAETFAIHAAR